MGDGKDSTPAPLHFNMERKISNSGSTKIWDSIIGLWDASPHPTPYCHVNKAPTGITARRTKPQSLFKESSGKP